MACTVVIIIKGWLDMFHVWIISAAPAANGFSDNCIQEEALSNLLDGPTTWKLYFLVGYSNRIFIGSEK